MKKLILAASALLLAGCSHALTVNKVVKASSNTFVTDSIIQDDGTRVGVGTGPVTGVTLGVQGLVKSYSGGFAFPDGSTQTFSGNYVSTGVTTTNCLSSHTFISNGAQKVSCSPNLILSETAGVFPIFTAAVVFNDAFYANGGISTSGTRDLDIADNTFFSSDSVISSSGTAPTPSSCGTSPSVVGSKVSGKITIGTSASDTCTVTFASAWAAAPACFVTGEDSAINLAATTTTTALVITAPGATDFSSDVIMYACIGQDGG